MLYQHRASDIFIWLYFTTKHDKWHHSERQSSKNTIILAPSVVLVISCLGCATSQALWPCAVDQFCQWQVNYKCLWILHSLTCHCSGLAKICAEPFNKYSNYPSWQDKSRILVFTELCILKTRTRKSSIKSQISVQLFITYLAKYILESSLCKKAFSVNPHYIY